jgi:hypothetical protein
MRRFWKLILVRGLSRRSDKRETFWYDWGQISYNPHTCFGYKRVGLRRTAVVLAIGGRSIAARCAAAGPRLQSSRLQVLEALAVITDAALVPFQAAIGVDFPVGFELVVTGVEGRLIRSFAGMQRGDCGGKDGRGWNGKDASCVTLQYNALALGHRLRGDAVIAGRDHGIHGNKNDFGRNDGGQEICLNGRERQYKCLCPAPFRRGFVAMEGSRFDGLNGTRGRFPASLSSIAHLWDLGPGGAGCLSI